MKKSILLIHTGGTISMKMNNDSGAVLPNEQNAILGISEQLSQFADIKEIEAFNLPSPHITPKEMLVLRNIIDDYTQKHPVDGIVITHGTDTLEETAYLLDLTTKYDFPIVLTGAMRSSNELGADGIYNLVEAVRVACSPEAKNKGVLVVMNDEIHQAFNITKTSTSSVNTFQSPQYGPIGLITKKMVHIHQAPVSRKYVNVQSIEKRVALLKVYAGMDGDILDAIFNLQYDGVVLEGLGQGNVPPAVVPAIKKLIDKNIPVVLVSRCFNGIAEGIYGYEGGGKSLEEQGVIFATGISGQKARLKLLIGLNQQNKPIDFREFFN